MLHKADQERRGNHSPIPAKWHNDNDWQKICPKLDGPRNKTLQCDRIAVENHSDVATRAERLRTSEHWILKLNQDGAQQPLKQRPDFAQAKRECKRLHDEYMARTQQECRTICRSQRKRKKGQAFERIDAYDYRVDPRTGLAVLYNTIRETCRLRPRRQIGTASIG